MATPQQIEDTLDSINNETERELAAHILIGTPLPRALGQDAIKNENLYLRKIEDWSDVGSIGMCRIEELNNDQKHRLAAIELKQAQQLQKDFSPSVTQTQSNPEPQQRQGSMLNSYRRAQVEIKPVSITPVQPVSNQVQPVSNQVQPMNDVLDTTKRDVLDLLKDRLEEVKKEVPGFRKGHEARKFALEEIIKEVGNENGKFTLSEIENRISDKLSGDDKVNFLKGIRADSSSKEGKESQYQIMKNDINQLTTPKESPTYKK